MSHILYIYRCLEHGGGHGPPRRYHHVNLLNLPGHRRRKRHRRGEIHSSREAVVAIIKSQREGEFRKKIIVIPPVKAQTQSKAHTTKSPPTKVVDIRPAGFPRPP